MISIKKYLDRNQPEELPTAEPQSSELFTVALECYRAALAAIGKNAIQICPSTGLDLERNLEGLDHRLSQANSAQSIQWNGSQIEVQLDVWGGRTSEYVRTQADVVKELLGALAKTAESVGNRDQGYSNNFRDLTERLERIADFDDLTRIRLSLAKSTSELKENVDRMARESRQMVAQLRTELCTYETRLKSVEQLALKDELTGLANRRSIEQRIERIISNGQEFSIVMLDLNNFKQVNDNHGHLVGDDVLKQFAMELKANIRSSDLAGRWGGDEFMVVISCSEQAAAAHVERIQKWVFGKYTVRGVGQNPLAIPIDAAIGTTAWRAGETLLSMIAKADAAMYEDKKRAQQKKPQTQENSV
jgi:diguanylate cyclase (GGDEF)-like protein